MLMLVPACVWGFRSTTDLSSACRNGESTPSLHLNYRCCRLRSAATATGCRHTHTTLQIRSRSCARHCRV
ncbi:hypothetical protein K438DRAFT_1866111 [Mycena galopus ATCC 62051]|nr:hypothetical protein K438DRAFT_1866111 [Mycena galopus ATCC 62051]